jgi:hypothetical protein
MIFEIYSKDPQQLLNQIFKSVDENTSRHMEHWEIVNEKGIDYLTQRDVKYYFKVLLLPEVLDKRKIRFTFLFHEYSDPTHFVQCEYVGQFTECIMYNFGDVIIGLQIYP